MTALDEASSADLDCVDPGEATAAGDCDDGRARTRPDAAEDIANGLDDDCDGQRDEDFP